MQQLASRSTEVLEALNDGVIVLGPDLRVDFFNSAASAVIPELAQGQSLEQCSPEFSQSFAEQISRAYRGAADSLSRSFFRVAGLVHYFNLKFAPLPATQNGPEGVVIVLEDITNDALSVSEVQDNYSELESELRTARKYQEALFTSDWNDGVLSCRAFGQPAFELSGDFFEIGKIGDNYLIVLGDVQSHGIEVAIKAIALQHLCRVNVAQVSTTSELMHRLNDFVFHDHQGTFWSCCLFVGLYNPASRMLHYSRAGTPEPLCFHADGSVEMLSTGDTPLGFFEEELYQEGQIEIRPNTRLLVFSDGVTESAPLEAPMDCYGQDRLILNYQSLIKPGSFMHHCSSLVDSVVQFHGSRHFNDDFTIAELIFN
ncbi:SpoIIE family protein phosphatase [bacterium]|nr:SpoIIE family protein phosphatase [bacterium]